jgi:hypothetical protein
MMETSPVVLKEVQMDKCIPGLISFREGMCFASEGIEPITEGTVNPLNMAVSGFGKELAKRRANLDGKSFPCSSRCLMVCVKRTAGGTCNKDCSGRPAWTG